MSKRLAILLRTLLQTDRQTQRSSVKINNSQTNILLLTLLLTTCAFIVFTHKHTTKDFCLCIFPIYTHRTENVASRVKVLKFSKVCCQCECVCVNKREKSPCLFVSVCVCVRLCDMHIFSIAFPLYVSILLRSLRLACCCYYYFLAYFMLCHFFFCCCCCFCFTIPSSSSFSVLFCFVKSSGFPCGLWSLSTSSVKCRNASVLSTEMSVYVCVCMCVYVVRLYVCFIFVAIAFFCFGVRFSFRRCHHPQQQRRCQSSSQVSHSADSFCLAETFYPAALMFTYLLFCFCL